MEHYGSLVQCAQVRELRSLTGVRAFAALWVLCFHSGISGLPHVPSPLAALINVGYSAVSLFFVLSGFILTYNYLPRGGSPTSRQAFGTYAVARGARIYPVYLLAMALAAIVEGPLLSGNGRPLPPFQMNLLTALWLQAWAVGS